MNGDYFDIIGLHSADLSWEQTKNTVIIDGGSDVSNLNKFKYMLDSLRSDLVNNKNLVTVKDFDL